MGKIRAAARRRRKNRTLTERLMNVGAASKRKELPGERRKARALGRFRKGGSVHWLRFGPETCAQILPVRLSSHSAQRAGANHMKEQHPAKPNTQENTGNLQKDPDDWVTGDEPMTQAQASYLKTLSEEAHEPVEEDLSKAEASKRIDELQKQTGRGLTRVHGDSSSDSHGTGAHDTHSKKSSQTRSSKR